MEASPATPTTITSPTPYDTTQESVQEELPLEIEVPSESDDQVPVVDHQVEVGADINDITEEEEEDVPPASLVDRGEGEGEVGVVVTLNEKDEDVHTTMASTLPATVIIQSHWNNRYVRFENENPHINDALRCDGDYSFGLETRFALVPSTNSPGYFHIRSLFNNKYWVHLGGFDSWITASSTEPEEDRSRADCTLFRPIFVHSNNNHVLRLLHVNTHRAVSPNVIFGGDHRGALSVKSLYNNSSDIPLFTILDWRSITVLPDRIRVKNERRGRHLLARSDAYLDFRNSGNNSSWYDYDVIPSRNGGVRLRSVIHNTYWTEESSTYIRLRQASETTHNTSTVFMPMVHTGDRILFRCLRSNNFCQTYSVGGKPQWKDRLAARASFPNDHSYMEVEEPVVTRTITNVRYRLDDARIYDETTLALVTDDATNRTQNPMTSALNLKFTVTNTSTWSNSTSLKLGLKLTGEAGLPFVANGKIEISTEVSNTWNWGETESESREVGNVRTVTVPPMSRVGGSLIGTRMSYDLPFSYTQIDLLANGTEVKYEKNDGIFTGVDGYAYKSEVYNLPFE